MKWADAPKWKLYLTPRFLLGNLRERGIARSARVWLAYFSLLPLAILVRVSLRLLKPLVHIRIGRLQSARMGSFARDPELYLCERDAGMQPSKTLDIWYHWDRDRNMLRHPGKPRDSICNRQLSVMWERTLHVWDGAGILDRLNRMVAVNDFIVPLRGEHIDDFIVPLRGEMDVDGLLDRFPPHLVFTPPEEERGLADLGEMGIGPNDKFVCFQARDSGYLDIARPMNLTKVQEWRFQDTRDCSIQNYVLAAERLTELGYFAIRMGKYVNTPLQCDNPRIIDYATKFHSDFMDVFLSARCSFFIGGGAGLNYLPTLFRRPVGFGNMHKLWDIQTSQYGTAITILKKFYSEERNRLLTYREVLDLGLARFSSKTPEHERLIDTLGLKIVENTPEEIFALAMELHHRLRSEFQWTEEDKELQSRFLTLLRAYPDDIPFWEEAPTPKFGTQFLKDNQALLE